MTPYIVDASIAPQVWTWITTRTGVQVWSNELVGSATGPRMTPVLDPDGQPNTQKPHWSCGKIDLVLTSLNEVEVSSSRELKRLRVALRRSGNGLSLKLTDGSAARARKACQDLRPWSCPCGWTGFAKGLKYVPVPNTRAEEAVCPKCKKGETLVEGPEPWFTPVYDGEHPEVAVMVEDRLVPLETWIKENNHAT